MAANLPLGWEAICATIGLISLFITVLVQMAAKAFSLQQLELWAKAEYAQVAVTFLIIAFAVGMVSAGNWVMGEVTGKLALASGNVELKKAAEGHLRDPFKIAKAYIVNGPIRCEDRIYNIVFRINFFVELASSISFDAFGVEGTGGSFALAGPVSLAHYINKAIVYLGIFHYVQYYLLHFSQYTMVQIFLPIGLILRSFAPTRGAGGFVCAFALAFGFVFPITYVLIVAMMPNSSHACTSISAYEEGEKSPCATSYGSAMRVYYEVKMNEEKHAGILEQIKNTITVLYMQALLYPLFALIITFTAMRQGSSLLGADLAEVGRGLLKII
ncbi:MAG: hypothetical protein N3E51_03230 [Candidatus Micrarchaeota archaeon]|nr:hypothetical protein [Candidatus Micrarchaeota archaeon]